MDAKELIKNRRSSLGLTQHELAERLSIYGQETSHARVSHWETGRNQPPLDDIRFRGALARALDLDVNEMMYSLGYVVSTDEQSQEARLGASIIDRLPKRVRELAIEQLRALEKAFDG